MPHSVLVSGNKREVSNRCHGEKSILAPVVPVLERPDWLWQALVRGIFQG